MWLLAWASLHMTLGLEKAGSTLRSSQAVPHPSTNRALRRLTSEFGRDPVHSTRYGRQRVLVHTARGLRTHKTNASVSSNRDLWRLAGGAQSGNRRATLRHELGRELAGSTHWQTDAGWRGRRAPVLAAQGLAVAGNRHCLHACNPRRRADPMKSPVFGFAVHSEV